MTQELSVEPQKDGIWTTRRNKPTVWWCKVEDFYREHVDMRMQVPTEIGKESAPLADGFIYWREEKEQKRPDGSTYKLLSINKELATDHQESKALAAQNASRFQNQKPWSGGWKNEGNDWYKVVDMQVARPDEVGGFLQGGYKLLNKTDVNRTSFWNPKLQEQMFVMVRTEKVG